MTLTTALRWLERLMLIGFGVLAGRWRDGAFDTGVTILVAFSFVGMWLATEKALRWTCPRV